MASNLPFVIDTIKCASNSEPKKPRLLASLLSVVLPPLSDSELVVLEKSVSLGLDDNARQLAKMFCTTRRQKIQNYYPPSVP